MFNPLPRFSKITYLECSLAKYYSKSHLIMTSFLPSTTRCVLSKLKEDLILESESRLNCFFSNRGKFFDYLNPNSKEGMGGYIVYEFTLLLRALWNSQYRVVSPVDLKAAMGKYRKQFKGTDQQDAQELLIALLGENFY